MKNTKFLWIVLVVAVLIIISGFYIFNQNKPQEITKVRIGNLPVVHGLPLYVAMEKGYFKDAGIDVEIVKFEAPNQIVDALMQDKIDFGDTTIALGITGIADYKNPGKIKIWAVSGEMGNNSGEDLILPIDSNITSIKDLKGKKLGINAGTIQWKTIAREILAQNGLDMDKDLTIVELAPSVQVQAVATKQVDALLALEPNPIIAISQGSAKMWIKAPAKQYIADPFWYGAGVVRTNFAQENPETTKKVIEVFDKTIKEINDNPDAYRQYLKGYTPLTDEIASKIPLVDFKLCEDINEKDLDSITKFYSIFTKHKVIDGQVNINSLLYCK